MEAAPDEVDADGCQIDLDEWLDDRPVDVGEEIGARNAADDAGYDEPREQSPIDILVQDVADRRDAGGEGFGGMDAGRSAAGRDTERQQQRAGDHAIGHAERPIDHLRAEADQDEGQNVAEIGDEGVDHPFPFGAFVYLDDRHIVPCKARLRLRADTGSLRRHWK